MTEPDGPGPTATSDALAGTEWEIVRVADEPVHPADASLLLSFGHDGRVSGSTGVNQLTASYSLTADYLTFGPLATTRRSGTPEQMEQEHRLVQSLAGMCSFSLTVHTLSIEGPLGLVELVSTTPLPEPYEPAPSETVAVDDVAPPPEDGS
jgi:heat shock protein HslJ